MELTEKTLRVNPVFQGKIIDVHVDDVELADGRPTKREVVDHPGGVSIAVLDARNNVALVRQYRYPYHAVLLELPAGKLEKGEDPLLAAKREQEEETGTRGGHYVSLGNVYPSPGYCGEIIRLWACRMLGEAGELRLDEGEFLENEWIPLEKAVEMVYANEIPDSKTQIGLLKAYALVKNGGL